MADKTHTNKTILGGLGQSISQLENVVSASLRPLPTETGNGTYIAESTETGLVAGLVQDMATVDVGDIRTLVEVIKNSATGEPVDDKSYVMERTIQLAAGLPATSRNGAELTKSFLKMLWDDLEHPPISYLGADSMYRKADGSGNNHFWPKLGAAGSPYARSVRPKTLKSPSLPDPEVIFDSILRRKEYKEHPNKISSVLFYLASIIIHDLFQTDSKDGTTSLTSSYLDLSPLYGNNQDEQDSVRLFEAGRLKPDCFATKRVLGFPPGVGVLLIMFSRFHNHVAENLAAINEGGRFTKPDDEADEAKKAKYDNDLFQTARLVTCGLYVNIILKDYVRTILNIQRTGSLWSLDPRMEMQDGLLGEGAALATGNQVSAEFACCYRWHASISKRDELWTESFHREIMPGVDPETLSLKDFTAGLGRWQAGLPKNPEERPFAGLQRQPDGTFNDGELANLWKLSVEDCAGAFGALHVPPIFRTIEALGIMQARRWNLGTLNELRAYFHLKPHKTFEDINSDPYIADQLKRLYDHPDLVEIYPGIIVEDAKEPMTPGSGLCVNYTISRAILSDAVALVRGDRFYTVDYTPKHLTNWAFSEIQPSDSVDQGHLFYKLVLRAFPNHFAGNSIYAHFPLVIPSENEKILKNLGIAEKYSWSVPKLIAQPRFIDSHAACMSILRNPNFMISGDIPPNAASRKMMESALYRDNWEDEVKKFYEQITLRLLHQKSYQLAGVYQVDIVRDLINPAVTNFVSSIFSLPLKTESNPRGVFTEVELYKIMTLIFTATFYDVDVSKSFELRQTARAVTQELGQLIMTNVEKLGKSGFIASLVNRLHRHDVLSEYGTHIIQKLLESGLKPAEIVWTHILPTASGMVATQARILSQCLDYYLGEGAVHLPEINRLAKEDTLEADELLTRYFMEGARLGSSVALPRVAAQAIVIEDYAEKIKIKAGQEVMCNLASACKDSSAFPEPDKVKLDRDMSLYAHFGVGAHECLAAELCKIGLTSMFKVIGRLDNLRRARGPQGHLKRISGPGGVPKYMNEDQTGFSPIPTTMKLRWDGPLPVLTDD
ncbi:Putative Psi-producing oxygenase A [Aspergillus calidoustus]|uniref:linoleate 8R-lipoxygenase n=1 Tax=Aspergillus calidoustus TaxID=454130 RepID=A0A0U5GWE1_ASPCI|nr:Putative Psi-producing oxygenase A [Aspergillus calidoustus]